MNKRKKIAIIDYQLGNLFSVEQACLYLEADAKITCDKNELLDADYAVLPGVGAFGDAMDNLKRLDLVEPIKDFIAAGKPFMGVCLGLQLLFSESEEFGTRKGLNLIEGTVTKFPPVNKQGAVLKVPQIEWNQIFEDRPNAWAQSPLCNVVPGDFMYFVHSYFVKPSRKDVVLSLTNYGGYEYCSSIKKENVFACQFHPEKSGLAGVDIYRNFLNEI